MDWQTVCFSTLLYLLSNY